MSTDHHLIPPPPPLYPADTKLLKLNPGLEEVARHSAAAVMLTILGCVADSGVAHTYMCLLHVDLSEASCTNYSNSLR
jgi:hypothetical protein